VPDILLTADGTDGDDGMLFCRDCLARCIRRRSYRKELQ